MSNKRLRLAPPISVRQTPEFSFTGDLVPSRAAYTSAVITTCGACVTDPCDVCKRPFHHYAVALQQPFESVTYETPILYRVLFSYQDPIVTYHDLVVGYSAVFVHLQELMSPDKEWLSAEWTEQARTKRAFARDLWSPCIHQHRDMIQDAFRTIDSELGRVKLLRAYQFVVACGLRAARSATAEEFQHGLNAELEYWNTSPQRASLDKDVTEFNAKHAEWARSYHNS